LFFEYRGVLISSTIRGCLHGFAVRIHLCVVGNPTVLIVCIVHGEGSQQCTRPGTADPTRQFSLEVD